MKLYTKHLDIGDKFRERICYYKNEEFKILHREDGPVIEFKDGSKQWWINGECHREDGPAVVFIISDGTHLNRYYINSVYYSEQQYWVKIRLGAFA